MGVETMILFFKQPQYTYKVRPPIPSSSLPPFRLPFPLPSTKYKNKEQVHIASFLYLQVQNIAYSYLNFEILVASTHIPICVLASTKIWLCVLASASPNSFFQFQISNFKFQIWFFKILKSTIIVSLRLPVIVTSWKRSWL